jgi:hypothetical protein
MAYSELGTVNLALQHLGIPIITTGDWATPATKQAIAANAAWEYVRNEVLEAADWHFAKTRTTLSKVAPRIDLNCGNNRHLYVIADPNVNYVSDSDIFDISIEIYTNSSDALSVVEDPADSKNIIIKLADTTSANNTAALIQVALRALATVNGVSVAAWTVTANAEYTAAPPTSGVDLDEVDMSTALTGLYYFAYTLPTDFLKIAQSQELDKSVKGIVAYNVNFDEYHLLRLRDNVYAYVVESLPDETKVLLINYDDAQYPLELVYIRKATDVTKWTAHFISAVAHRLAAELAFPLTEDPKKFEYFMNLYNTALMKAKELNQSSDWVEHETGDDSWDVAGRMA